MRIVPSLAALTLVACAADKGPVEPNAPRMIQLSSPAFAANGAIPAKYTCDGSNLSPPLGWVGAPPDTHGYALVVDDPDAGKSHWVMPEIPSRFTTLLEGAGSGPGGRALGGNTHWILQQYQGPCPPTGMHHYRIRIYALDEAGIATAPMSEAALLSRIRGHVLAQGELDGTYARTK